MRTRALRMLQGLVMVLAAGSCAPPPAQQGQAGPVERIVSLAPHLTEMVYAVGAGDRLVGAVEFSDFPPAARDLPRIGDAFRVDYEVLAMLSPDLILAWRSGNPPALVERLRSLGYRVEEFDAASLDNLPGQLRRLGELAGEGGQGARAAAALRDGLAALGREYAGASPVRVFYQVAREPLFTVTDRHVIGQLIGLCGGHNVFGEMEGLSPVIGVEAVLTSAPDAILVGGPPADFKASRDMWQQWTTLPAAVTNAIYSVDADLISRPGPRLVQGAVQVCQLLARVREQKDVSPVPFPR